MTPYNALVIHHFDSPNHMGCIKAHPQPIHTGQVEALNQQLQIQCAINPQHKIEQAKFKASAEPYVIAGLSLMTEWLTGKTLHEALNFNYEDLARQLGLPLNKRYCIILIEDVINATIHDSD